MILGIETSCDETAAALVTAEGEIRANVVSSQAELHARFGGVVPEVASRRHLELVAPVVQEAFGQAGATLDDVETVAVTQGPGPGGSAARRPLRREGARLGTGAAAGAGRPPARPRRVALSRARPGRAAVPLPARERRSHASARRAGPRRLPRPRHLDRRRRRRGVRQGSPAARARLSRRRRDRPARAVGRSRGFLVSGGAPRRPRLLVLGGEDRAPLHRSRPRATSSTSRKADLAASYQRAIVRALVERTRAAAEQEGLDTIAVVGGVAANSELRESLPGARFAPLPLCTDNAAMIASAGRYGRRLPYPRYLDLDAYASRA